ncbi:MAG: hypothetical protein V1773_04415 [bacterium]
MMIKKYISPFVCGFSAGVLQIVPVAKSFACCLIIPVAAYFSLLLDQKANKDYSRITVKKAITFGILTGLNAALFGTLFEVIITLITKNNDLVSALPEVQKMLVNFPIDPHLKKEVLALLNGVIYSIKHYGFSFIYSFSILMNNLIINTLFGLIGGLIAMQIINKKNSAGI